MLSVAQLCDLGFTCTFSDVDVVIASKEHNDLTFKGFRYDNIYIMDFSSNEANIATCLFSKASLG
uniref:Uncharacterized protein n=1 Tax=Arundo donax TaxID=35708 RepID=A0A0A9GYR9_ARUDO